MPSSPTPFADSGQLGRAARAGAVGQVWISRCNGTRAAIALRMPKRVGGRLFVITCGRMTTPLPLNELIWIVAIVVEIHKIQMNGAADEGCLPWLMM